MLSDGRDRSGAALKVPSVLECAVMIIALKMSLRLRGFARTLEWIGYRVQGVPPLPSVDSEALRASEHAVAMAGALYPGRALCLEQSLVLYYLLRRQGVPVKYCQGVQPRPFEAHAWIEYQHRPLNDVTEHVKLFARLPGQLP